MTIMARDRKYRAKLIKMYENFQKIKNRPKELEPVGKPFADPELFDDIPPT